MRLAHFHYNRLISYTRSLALQDEFLNAHFKHKDHLLALAKNADNTAGIAKYTNRELTDRNLSFSHTNTPSLETQVLDVDNKGRDPIVLTFSTSPTYTVGRRHLQRNPISDSQQSFLSASGAADFHASPRGGLLTYHAPGQLTAYVIANLRTHGITPRCWVKMLESSVMRTCAAFGVENTSRTDDPGVWIKGTDRKICAVGVQVSRGVTTHGIGLNVYDCGIPHNETDEYAFTDAQVTSPSYDPTTKGYLSWGFSRIVACGLEGKSVTWLEREAPLSSQSATMGNTEGEIPNLMSTVADVFAKEIARGINEMKSPGSERITGVETSYPSD